jgi:hypothetical protein
VIGSYGRDMENKPKKVLYRVTEKVLGGVASYSVIRKCITKKSMKYPVGQVYVCFGQRSVAVESTSEEGARIKGKRILTK